MALNFVVKTLLAVLLFLGSEGQRSISRRPCKFRTERFNATGFLFFNSDDRSHLIECYDNGLECPTEWVHPTQVITFPDKSPGPTRTTYTLGFCEIPYCGREIPLCNATHNYAAALHIYTETRPGLTVYCRCSDGFRSLQYAGEDWLNQTYTQRLFKCELPECNRGQRCIMDTLQDPGLPDSRRVVKYCNCSPGKACNNKTVNDREHNYFCSNP